MNIEETNDLLHVLRNPYGKTSELIDQTRLQAADRIEELEALTKRLVKRTGELTGQTDKHLRRIEHLEAALKRLGSQHINLSHADSHNAVWNMKKAANEALK